MQELLFFMLPHCPHCQLARRYLEALRAENKEYAAIKITEIDESREKALADQYDYFLVPSFFLNGKKLHEGHAERSDVEAVLRVAAEAARS